MVGSTQIVDEGSCSVHVCAESIVSIVVYSVCASDHSRKVDAMQTSFKCFQPYSFMLYIELLFFVSSQVV